MKLPIGKLYLDFKYNGLFKIAIANKKFFMFASGGSIENELFWKGKYEPEILWLWIIISKNFSCVIDIGANIGIYSLITKTINPDCTVFAFEPSEKTFIIFQKNIKINNYSIISEKLALSNKTGFSKFYDIFDEFQESASLSPEMVKNKTDTCLINEYLVKTTTLDEYVSANKINKIDCIKIDVELHEPEVFEGMKNVLKTHKPYLFFEVLLEDVSKKLNIALKENNYNIYSFIKEDNEYKISLVDKLEAKPDGDWNYFGCPVEKADFLFEQINRK